MEQVEPLNAFTITGTLTVRPWIAYSALGKSSVQFAVGVPSFVGTDVLQVIHHTDDEAADAMLRMSPGERARFTGRITNRFTEGVTETRVVLVAEAVERA